MAVFQSTELTNRAKDASRAIIITSSSFRHRIVLSMPISLSITPLHTIDSSIRTSQLTPCGLASLAARHSALCGMVLKLQSVIIAIVKGLHLPTRPD